MPPLQASHATRYRFGACLWIVLLTASGCGGDGATDLTGVPPTSPSGEVPAETPSDPVETTCALRKVVAGTPVRNEPDSSCSSGYLVDFSIETNRASTTVMDVFDLYPVSDWRVMPTEDGIRHDFRVHWAPYRNQVAPFRRMTIEACPGEAGSLFLACSDVSCDLYDDAGHIPPLTLPDTVAVFRHDRESEDPPQLQEGDAIEIQMDYEVLRPSDGNSATVVPSTWTRYPSWEIEFTPPTHRIPLSAAGSGTMRFLLQVLENEGWADVEVHHVEFDVQTHGVDGCVGAPATFQILVEDAR